MRAIYALVILSVLVFSGIAAIVLMLYNLGFIGN